ncbi:MAG: radical SAM family heme chaperone HemW [Halieaceae bacterium]
MTGKTLPPISLYVHLPWCERKCPYCDFNSHEREVIPEQDYIAVLLADLQDSLPQLQGRGLSSLFIGGGTPSLFSAESIATLMDGLRENADLSNNFEATMEANPGSAEAQRFKGYRDAGITRLSLGIQSFDDGSLTSLGRVHNSEQGHAAIGMAKAANFDSFNIDLMHGLPGQDTTSAMNDLDTALGYAPPHLSWYQLTIEPNTVFHNRPPLLPVEDTLADIQDSGEHRLSQAGLQQYEVSAYAGDKRQCRHNRNYWLFGDYIGIGAGAHGKISYSDGRIERYAKRRQPEAYMTADQTDLMASRRVLEARELPAEFVLNALRLNEGFSLAGFTERTGLSATSLQPQLDSLVAKGLLTTRDERVCTTELGRRFLDTVVAEFLPD